MTDEETLSGIAESLYDDFRNAYPDPFMTTEDMLDGCERRKLKPWAEVLQDPVQLARWHAVASTCVRIAAESVDGALHEDGAVVVRVHDQGSEPAMPAAPADIEVIAARLFETHIALHACNGEYRVHAADGPCPGCGSTWVRWRELRSDSLTARRFRHLARTEGGAPCS